MDTVLSLRGPAASETEAFAQPLELRADPFAAEFPLEPGDRIGARLGAQLCEPRHVTYARVQAQLAPVLAAVVSGQHWRVRPRRGPPALSSAVP